MYQRSGNNDPQKRAKPPIPNGKADASKTEGRRAEHGSEAEAERKVANQELKQRPDER